jgi:hypothetical protein
MELDNTFNLDSVDEEFWPEDFGSRQIYTKPAEDKPRPVFTIDDILFGCKGETKC